jgi:hypothetical protein
LPTLLACRPPPPPPAAALAAAAAAQLGGAGAGRILEREARKSALFSWLQDYVWSSAATNWLPEVGRVAKCIAQAAQAPTMHTSTLSPPPWPPHPQARISPEDSRPATLPLSSRRRASRLLASHPSPPSSPLGALPGAGTSATKPEQYRALVQGFARSEMAAARAPSLARHLAHHLGLVGRGEEVQGALGQAAAAALEALVASAMLAWLRAQGCGGGHRITVGAARRQGSSSRGG